MRTIDKVEMPDGTYLEIIDCGDSSPCNFYIKWDNALFHLCDDLHEAARMAFAIKWAAEQMYARTTDSMLERFIKLSDVMENGSHNT